MTRRSELELERDEQAEWLRCWRDRQERDRLHCRKPGIVQRVTAWGILHFGLLASVSLVGWLLAFALAALFFLPGCSDPGLNAREDGAFQETENQLARYGDALANGTADAEHYKAFLHDTLENLKTAERGERDNAGSTWSTVLDALIGAVIGGGALHLRRNVTRKADLAALTEKLRAEFLEQLEAKGGAG